MIWGVVVFMYNIVVQGETVRPSATVNRVKDNEIVYLLTSLALRVTIPFRYAAKTPSIRGQYKEDAIPNGLMTCGVAECEHGVGWWYGYRLEARRGEDE